MAKQVLLCDDEIHIIRAAQIKISRAGYEVVCARDGEEAWALIQQHVPDLLITDCQMPRMNGLELCEKVRQHEASRDLPIFMLTAKGFELAHTEIDEKWGVAQIIAKPFSPRELVQSVERVLGGAEAAVVEA